MPKKACGANGPDFVRWRGCTSDGLPAWRVSIAVRMRIELHKLKLVASQYPHGHLNQICWLLC